MAYSSIGHMGYALIGLAAGTPNGIRGVLIYLVTYVFMNAGTFACIIAMRRRGRMLEGISDLSGLGRTDPMLALAMTVFMFSMAGIPPFSGFCGKYFIFTAAVQQGMWTLAVIGVLTSVIGAYLLHPHHQGDVFRRRRGRVRPAPGLAVLRGCRRGAVHHLVLPGPRTAGGGGRGGGEGSVRMTQAAGWGPPLPAWRLQIFDALPSTSDLCRSLAAAGEPEGLAVLARRQDKGRGSRGRLWVSAPGNLFLSVLLRPGGAVHESGVWSLLGRPRFVGRGGRACPACTTAAEMAERPAAGRHQDGRHPARQQRRHRRRHRLPGDRFRRQSRQRPGDAGTQHHRLAAVAPPPLPEAFAASLLARLDHWRGISRPTASPRSAPPGWTRGMPWAPK